MLQSDSREVGKLESTEVKAAKAPTAPRAYSAPELVVLGQAHTLVQGSDYTKMTQESNGYFYD